MNVEESLLELEGKAALVRYVASCATINPERPDRAALAGIGDVCSDIESLARRVKYALSADALAGELTRRR